jgi:hypothetical protein
MDESIKIIEEMVLSKFGLSSSSNFRFSNAIKNRFIDETFKDYVNEDNRIVIKLPLYLYKEFDEGWTLLREMMPFLIEEYDITYNDFRKNKILYEKNNLKIIKMIKNYFIKNNKLNEEKIANYISFLNSFLNEKIEYIIELKEKYNNDASDLGYINFIIKEFVDRLNEVRLSVDKHMFIVISFNYKDMFLSSTAEDWSSCLNLESRSFACYWASLPGAAIDKNLGILYITNGSEKFYNGINADKMISRSFFLLDNNNVINIIKFYPNEIIKLEKLKDIIPFDVKWIDKEYKNKYEIESLRYKNNLTCYLYQDKTNLILKENGNFDLIYNNGKKGLYTFYKNKFFEGPIFNYTEGFKNLKESLINFQEMPVKCEYCNKIMSYHRAFKVDGLFFCERHYEEYEDGMEKFYCESCGKRLNKEDVYENDYGVILCHNCYEGN